jgi:hypothetical protein
MESYCSEIAPGFVSQFGTGLGAPVASAQLSFSEVSNGSPPPKTSERKSNNLRNFSGSNRRFHESGEDSRFERFYPRRTAYLEGEDFRRIRNKIHFV